MAPVSKRIRNFVGKKKQKINENRYYHCVARDD